MINSDDKGIKSNLTIRSNLYVRDTDKILRVGESLDKKFLAQVRGLKALKILENLDLKRYMDEFQQHHLENRFCGIKSETKETTFGPIKKDGKIVYSCRCIQKDQCEKHRVCEKCTMFRG